MAYLRSTIVAGLLLLAVLVPLAKAQEFGPSHVVIPSAYANVPTGILAPVDVCYHNDPLTLILSSTFQQSGNAITLTVHVEPTLCFSAGDPLVEKAVRFAMPPLAPGAYTLRYQRYEGATNDFLSYDEIVAFDVVDGAAVPTLTDLSLALLAALMLCVGWRFGLASKS